MTKKVTFSVRIQEDTVAAFDQKIIDQYSTTRNHKAEVVEKLLREYIDQDQQQQIIQNNTQQIQALQQQLQNMKEEKQQLEDQVEHYKTTTNDIQQDLEKTQQKLDKQEQKLEDQTTEHKEELNQLKKEKTTWSNKYTHQVEVHNKLQEENSRLHNKLEKYTYFFGKVTNMSFMNRVLGKFPEEIKELQPATQQTKEQE